MTTTSKFYSPYKAIFDAVQDALEALVDDEDNRIIKTVLLGEQFTLGDLPKAIINPLETTLNQVDIVLGKHFEVTVNFEVLLVIQEYEPKNWFTDIILPMGYVVDALLDNRTLSGKVDDLVPLGFTPAEIGFKQKEKNQLLYGGVIRAKAKMIYSS